MKILISDPIDEKARHYLEDKGLKFNYRPDISSDDLASLIYQYDALLVRSRTKVSRQLIEKGKNLKVVGRIGSGFDNIDLNVCKEKQITVVNAPDANSVAVAEFTVCLMITILRELPRAIASMKEGLWIKNDIWGHELNDQTVGIIGFGYVGSKVDRLVSAFGAKTLIWSRSQQTATLSEIFEKSDIVTIHLALNEQTRGLIDMKLLSLMKSTSVFMNLARGELVNEDDLYEVVSKKKIRGAILDVYWQEPMPSDCRWRSLENVILTPHIGAATREALSKASMTVAEDVVRVLKGEKPKYQVKII